MFGYKQGKHGLGSKVLRQSASSRGSLSGHSAGRLLCERLENRALRSVIGWDAGLIDVNEPDDDVITSDSDADIIISFEGLGESTTQVFADTSDESLFDPDDLAEFFKGQSDDMLEASPEDDISPDNNDSDGYADFITTDSAVFGQVITTSASIDVALVDSTLDDFEILSSSFNNDVFVIEYDGDLDSAIDVLDQVIELSNSVGLPIETLTIMSHGGTGQFELGSDIVSIETIAGQEEAWGALGENLTDGANIYLFGCNVAADTGDGVVLLNGIADLTGADVFASDDITGGGGDWELEAASKDAENELAAGLAIPADMNMLGGYSGTLNNAPTLENWWNGSWLNRTQITFDNTNSAEDLTDFPVLVTLTAADVDFANIKADGADIRFVDDDGTLLNYEIEAWDDGAETASIWVKVQQLDQASNTDFIHLYYNNAAATDAQNAPGVWTAGTGVYHLDEDPGPGGAGDIKDSDGTANNGTAEASMTNGDLVAGQIGNAIDFDGTDDFIDFASTDVGNTFTIEAWVKPTSASGHQTIVVNSLTGADTDGFRFFIRSDGEIRLETGNGSAGNLARTASGVINYDQWNHVAVEVDRSTGTATIFHNGADVTTDGTIRNDFNTSSVWNIGQFLGGALPFDGEIDEFRISSAAHSADWIEASYLSQNGTFAFNTLGSEEMVTSIADVNVNEDAVDSVVDLFGEFDDIEDADTDMTYTITGNTNGGLFDATTIDGVGGTLTLDYAADQNGTADITVRATDTGGLWVEDTFTVTVTAQNDAPTTSNIADVNVNEDAVDSVIDLFGEFDDIEDADGDLTYTITGNTNGGLFDATTIDGVGGTLTLDYAASQSGTADITVRATDSGGLWVEDTFTVTVNDRPTTTGLADVNVNEDAVDTVVDLFGAFDDIEDADADLTYTITGNTNGGLFDATTIDGVGGTLTLDYAADQNGTADITVRTTDSGGLWVEDTFTVTVTAQNDTPTTSNIADVNVNEDAVDTVVDLFGEFDDIEDADANLTYTITGNTNGGLFAGTTIDGVAGTLTLDYAGDANGTADITVRATDSGGLWVEDTFTVTVTAQNDTPTTSNIADVNVNEDAVDTVVDLFGEFDDVEDADGDLTYTITGNTNGGLFDGTTIDGVAGTLTLDYAGDANGTANITVRATDSGGLWVEDTFTVTVTAQNDTPTTSNIADVNVNEDAVDTVVDLFGEFDDIEDADANLTYTITGNTNGGLFDGTTIDGVAGTLTLDYAGDANGTADITVRATDSGGLWVEESFRVTVWQGNDVPTTTGIGDVNVNEDAVDTVVDLFGAFDDIEDADADLTYTITSNSNAGLFAGTTIDGVGGTLTLDYGSNQSGAADITVRATDTGGAWIETSFTVTVTAQNDTPTTSNIADVNVNEDAADTVIDLYGEFDDIEDADADLTYTITSNTNTNLFINTKIHPVTGTLTLKYASHQNGAADITVRATDSGGLWVEDTFRVTVSADNDGPVAVDDTASTTEDIAVITGNVLANDTDIDGNTLTINNFTQPANGTVLNNGDGTFTYTPGADYYGSDSFTYTVSDGNGGSDTATVNVTVGTANDGPVAVDDTASTTEDIAVITGNVLANDTDIDGDTLTVSNFTQPTNGTVVNNGDGTFTYTPGADYNGSDSFTYTVSDGNGGSDTGTVNVTVGNANDGPVAVDDTASTNEDSSVTTGNVLGNDTDIDGDTLTVSNFTQPGNGTVVNNGDGTFTYTPGVDYNGSDSFTYTVSDGNGGSDTATINITVKAVNDAPEINQQVFDVNENSTNDTVVGNVTAGDIDAGDTLTYAIIDGNTDNAFAIDPNSGGITVNNGGALDYETHPIFNLTVQVTDNEGLVDNAIVNINLNDVYEAPPVDNQPTSNDTPTEIAPPVVTNPINVDDIFKSGNDSPGLISPTDNDTISDTNVNTSSPLKIGPVKPGDQQEIVENSDVDQQQGNESSDNNDLVEGESTDDINNTSENSTNPSGSSNQTSGYSSQNSSQVGTPTANHNIQGTSSQSYQSSERIDGGQNIEEELLAGEGTHQATGVNMVAFGNVGVNGTVQFHQDAATLQEQVFQEQLDNFAEEVDDQIDSQSQTETVAVGVVTGVTGAVSFGYGLWALKGGSLLASMASNLPILSSIDPLPILEHGTNSSTGRRRHQKAKQIIVDEDEMKLNNLLK